jgi:Zn-dependent protease
MLRRILSKIKPTPLAVVKPAVVRPSDETTTVGRIFDTPLVVKGITWYPVVQLATLPIMAWYAGKRDPGRSLAKRLGVGILTMPIVLGSEWCHNLAHAAVARWIGKPMDAIRITWGMPLLVYYDIEDENVTPRQHILRSLGGPAFNAMALCLALPLQRSARPGSLSRELLDTAVATNAFLLSVGLLPLPGIDGGPILKWSLVERGRSPKQADEVLRQVDGLLGVVLGLMGGAALKRRRWLLGGLCLQLAAIALGVALGFLKEQD